MSQNRSQFREEVFARENNTCIVPWCSNKADDAHHILERSLWNNGGYISQNGVGVCNKHHKYAEESEIPPQAFYQWIGITDPELPETVSSKFCDKWGKSFDTPPHPDLRNHIKYQSTRHALPLYWYDSETTAKERIEHDDTGIKSLSNFVGIPLVITQKMDGSNCMLVSDMDNPVRARNGSQPLDTMRPLYRDGGIYWTKEINQKLPERLQVFGEWLFAKHSIHYGCDCDPVCEDVGPKLSDLVDYANESAYYQIFGVYDTKLQLWLSWPETKEVAKTLDLPTVPLIYEEDNCDNATFKTEQEARTKLIEYARETIDNGGEGIVVRSKFPFHYGQFTQKVAKYVRENHVKTDEHWKHTETVQNNI